MTSLPLGAIDRADLDCIETAVSAERWAQLKGGQVLLTGGTGFVGKWLLSGLLVANQRHGLGCRVTLLSRDPTAFAAQAPHLARAQGVTLVDGDVRRFDPGKTRYSHVLHAATDVVSSVSPLDTFDTCVAGTRCVLDVAARSGADVLLVSSGAVYGRQPADLPSLPETYAGAPDPLLPASAYGEGKRAAEWLGTAYATARGLRVVSARCFAFVGPYLPLDKHFAIGNFLRDALVNRPILIQGDGTPFRSYLYAADMAAWLWAALLGGRSQAAYNVGGDEAVSIAQLARRVVAALGSKSEIQVLKAAAPGVAAERYVPDVNLIRRELRLPQPLTLDEAVRRTALWHQRRIPRT